MRSAAGLSSRNQKRQNYDMLRCVECHRTTTGNTHGWRAYLSVDEEVVIYCPYCAEREFGARGRPGEFDHQAQPPA